MKSKIFILIKKASLEFEKLSIPMFTPYDLTPSQYKVLRLLYLQEPDSVRQIDIERFYSMTNPTVTGILNKLEKKGWIKRIPNPKDSRSNVISLTDQANQQRTELLHISDVLEDQLTVRLDSKEKQQLIDLLNKMLGEESSL